MKKFILHILLFFAIVAVVDFAAGKAFRYLQSHAGGRTGAEWYVCKQMNEDIIIMGSSRASHHYLPQIISDSLGMGCYNAGQDGNGVVLQYGRWKMISKRHIPKVIIYDVVPAFDLLENDNITYIDRLKPYADDKDVLEYISDYNPFEHIKLFSRMYRFNYKFLEIMLDCVKHESTSDGYIPNKKHIRQEVINASKKEDTFTIDSFDEVKMNCLSEMITEAQGLGVKVVLVSSPYWRGYPDVDMHIIKELADAKGVPFINYTDSDIRKNADWFADSMHLNEEGANEFTKRLVCQLRVILGI